jgi:hypothetical protein
MAPGHVAVCWECQQGWGGWLFHGLWPVGLLCQAVPPLLLVLVMMVLIVVSKVQGLLFETLVLLPLLVVCLPVSLLLLTPGFLLLSLLPYSLLHAAPSLRPQMSHFWKLYELLLSSAGSTERSSNQANVSRPWCPFACYILAQLAKRIIKLAETYTRCFEL